MYDLSLLLRMWGVALQLGVTDGARYMASNSGGSWLNTAFSFQDKVTGTKLQAVCTTCNGAKDAS
jgi:hypothetical protein